MDQNVNEFSASFVPDALLTEEASTPRVVAYETQEYVKTSRNSQLRQLVSPYVSTVAETVSNSFPNLTADQLTKAGALAVFAAGSQLLIKSHRPVAPTVLYTAGSLLDAVDGTYARMQNARNGTESTTSGMLLDVTADKAQEIFTATTLSIVARKRRNKLAANFYALAAMSAALPALMRSATESKGLIVGENGLGTRVTRAVLGGIGMGLNETNNASNAVSALLVAGSVLTSVQRGDVVLRGEVSKHCSGTNKNLDFTEDANTRHKRLQYITGAGLIAGVAALAYRPKATT